MADVTGAVHHSFDGKDYTLRLTFAVLGKLQAKHGDDLKGLLSGKASAAPPFAVMVDAIAGALVKGGVPTGEADELADDMLTADPELFPRVMSAAFPDAVGNGKAAAAA